MIDQQGTLAPRPTGRPRHRAAPRPNVLTAALRDVTYSEPERRGMGARTGAGAIASGLVLASIGVLVTMMIAASGPSAPRPHLIVPVKSASHASAAIRPVPVTHPVVHTHAAPRPKRTPAHHAPQPSSGSLISRPVTPAPQPSPWTPSSGLSYWRQLAEHAGAPTWAVNMFSAPRHRWR